VIDYLLIAWFSFSGFFNLYTGFANAKSYLLILLFVSNFISNIFLSYTIWNLK